MIRSSEKVPGSDEYDNGQDYFAAYNPNQPDDPLLVGLSSLNGNRPKRSRNQFQAFTMDQNWEVKIVNHLPNDLLSNLGAPAE